MPHAGPRFCPLGLMTKMGVGFVFDRATGKPVFPVEERPVPASNVPGEETWPTQPFPVKPPPLNRQGFSEEDMTNLSPESAAAMLAIVKKSRLGPLYTPPSLQGTLQ